MTPAPITSELLRHFGQSERAGRRDDALLVDVDAGQRRDVRAGGDDDGLGLERLRLAVGGLDVDLAGRGDAAGAVKRLDLVLLEQELDALDVAVDASVLVCLHRRQIELGLPTLMPICAKLCAGLLEQFARRAAAPWTGCSRH